MKSIVWAAVLMFAMLTLASAPIAHAGSIEDLQAARAALQKHDWSAAERNADAAIKAGDLRGNQLAWAYYLRGVARWGQDRRQEAADDMTEALKHVDKEHDFWADILGVRMTIFGEMEKWRESAADFMSVAKARPAAAKTVDFSFLARLIWNLEDIDEAATFEILRTVRFIGYTPSNPGDNMDYLIGLYVRLLVQRGDTQGAVAELTNVTTAGVLIEARVDRRYASIWTMPAFQAATDPSTLARRQLDGVERRRQQASNVAGLITQHVSALREAGQFEKAITIAREALQNPAALKAEGDGDLLWLRNELVYALHDVGRTNEMFAEMDVVLKLDPAKDGNVVNQLINFAEIMAEHGRAADAVQTARRAWDASSPYGRLFIQMVEVCAYADTDKPRADATLATMTKAEGENHAARMAALLCLDRSDAAATLMKQRLAKPDARDAVLLAVQNYQPPPFQSPMRKRLMDRFRVVVGRPEVRKEIEKFGRIETFPIFSGYWGTL